MAGMVRKSPDDPEEIRPCADGKGRLDPVNAEAGGVGGAALEPGWQGYADNARRQG
ncbi:hypothetical protein ACFQ36_00090 [Arthrobacter sp. GCM10027362]|uniref:hypothetical protein n=1 Tax=Arthrobacter sp. GCM10027362 TaxID=3273379 RepID=UPI0036454278